MTELTQPEIAIAVVVLLWLGCAGGILAYCLNAVGGSSRCNQDCEQGRRCTCLELDVKASNADRRVVHGPLTIKDS